MLAKKQRLTQAQFQTYFKSGKRFHSPNLQLIYVVGEFFSGSAVVGKKVFKQAAKRNTLRRRLYGVLYRHHKKHQNQGVFILVAKPSVKNISHQELLKETQTLLQKIRV